jgi:DNA-directed RNA polymerase specialized sigma24 family protein
VISDGEIEHLSAGVFVDPLEAQEVATRKQHTFATLRQACQRLAPDDRQLLHLRFGRSLPVVTIASLLGTDARPLYRRIERLLRSLRDAFVVAGLTATSKGRRPRESSIRRRVAH